MTYAKVISRPNQLYGRSLERLLQKCLFLCRPREESEKIERDDMRPG